MGVYIKGMEMPTNCDKCIYSAWSNFYQIYVCDAVGDNEPVLFDGKQTKSSAVARSARADNCPLTPVPPHGRLIDENALLKGCGYIIADGMACIPVKYIAAAPTIIPAEIISENEIKIIDTKGKLNYDPKRRFVISAEEGE